MHSLYLIPSVIAMWIFRRANDEESSTEDGTGKTAATTGRGNVQVENFVFNQCDVLCAQYIGRSKAVNTIRNIELGY